MPSIPKLTSHSLHAPWHVVRPIAERERGKIVRARARVAVSRVCDTLCVWCVCRVPLCVQVSRCVMIVCVCDVCHGASPAYPARGAGRARSRVFVSFSSEGSYSAVSRLRRVTPL